MAVPKARRLSTPKVFQFLGTAVQLLSCPHTRCYPMLKGLPRHKKAQPGAGLCCTHSRPQIRGWGGEEGSWVDRGAPGWLQSPEHRANKRTCLAFTSRPLGHGRLITRYNPCQVLLPTPGPAAWPPAPRCSPRVSKCHPGARDLPEQSSDISVPVTFHQPRLPRSLRSTAPFGTRPPPPNGRN